MSNENKTFGHYANNVLLEHDTLWKGEAAVSAWEMGSGGWGNFWIAWGLTLWALGVGVIFFPISTYKSFVRGRYSLNPFILRIQQTVSLQKTITILRKEFLFDRKDFKASIYNKFNFGLWSIIGVTWFILSFITLIMLFRALM